MTVLQNAEPAGSPSRAVVLVSGGLDSATCLAVARSRMDEVYALTVDYGQRHAVELRAASSVVGFMGAAQHAVVPLDLTWIGGSALTTGEPVPHGNDVRRAREQPIPSTYVPARNSIFLALALGWAEVLSASEIYIGVTAVDYSGYPDCRPEFIAAFQTVANLGTRAGINGCAPVICAPLVGLGKAEIIQLGISLGVDYGLTHSCYDPGPDDLPCGSCDSCQLRANGFAALGLDDPALRRSSRKAAQRPDAVPGCTT